jgi:hypothetical protein
MYEDKYHKNDYFFELFKTYSQYITRSDFLKFQFEILKILDFKFVVGLSEVTKFYQENIEKD